MDKDGRLGVDAVLGEGLDGVDANAGAVCGYPHHGALVPEGRLLEQLGHLPDDSRVAYVPAPADLSDRQGGPALESPTVVLDHEIGYGRRRDLQRRAPPALLVGVAQLVYDLLGERLRRAVVERLLYYRDRGVVVALGEVYPHVYETVAPVGVPMHGRGGTAHSTTSASAGSKSNLYSVSNILSMASREKIAPSSSPNTHRYSCSNHLDPSALLSSARNSGLMRGT